MHVTCSIYKLVEDENAGDEGGKGPEERRLTTMHLWEDGTFKCSNKEIQEKVDNFLEAEAEKGPDEG